MKVPGYFLTILAAHLSRAFTTCPALAPATWPSSPSPTGSIYGLPPLIPHPPSPVPCSLDHPQSHRPAPALLIFFTRVTSSWRHSGQNSLLFSTCVRASSCYKYVSLLLGVFKPLHLLEVSSLGLKKKQCKTSFKELRFSIKYSLKAEYFSKCHLWNFCCSSNGIYKVFQYSIKFLSQNIS